LTSSHTKTAPLVVQSFALSALNSKDSDSSGSSAKGIKSHSWKIDGVSANDGDTVPADGKAHKVELTVTDDEGNSATTVGWVKIDGSKPTASFTLASTCTPGEVINLSGNGTDSDGTVTGYKWRVGSTATTADTTVTCPASGSQEVCLTVTDNDNQDSSEVCHTTTVSIPTSCVITATNASDAVVTSLTYSTAYTFDSSNCPVNQCTWAIHSTKNVGQANEYVNDCLNDGKEASVQTDGSLIATTCGDSYTIVDVNLTCPNGVTGHKQYILN
jgi:hypothetical protein